MLGQRTGRNKASLGLARLADDIPLEGRRPMTPEEIVSRIHNEFARGPGNSCKYVGPGGMWKVNAVLELMRLAYLQGLKDGSPEAEGGINLFRLVDHP